MTYRSLEWSGLAGGKYSIPRQGYKDIVLGLPERRILDNCRNAFMAAEYKADKTPVS